MRIVLGGASGLIGSALAQELTGRGHDVRRLVRSGGRADGIPWDPAAGVLDPTALNGVDAVIHLSGESVASGRWTAARKKSIRDSRVRSTQLLANAIAAVDTRPATWLCASAIGYYGDRGGAWLDETSPAGNGFLAGVCQEWEAATAPAANAGVRVANLRFGVVLSRDGGALKQMAAAFKLGAGGVIGTGTQYMSWITLRDAVRAVLHTLEGPSVRGPVNIVSPNPVTNRELTKAVGAALRRPTVLPMPAPLARLVFGEMANEMFLASTCVRPMRLLESGFVFEAPELAPALCAMLGKE